MKSTSRGHFTRDKLFKRYILAPDKGELKRQPRHFSRLSLADEYNGSALLAMTMTTGLRLLLIAALVSKLKRSP
jgi:hypothetical protein